MPLYIYVKENVYDISISLNMVFVFELWIGFDLVPRFKIVRKGCRIMGFWRNTTASKSNQNSNVGGGGTLFQWQALEKEEFVSAIYQWGTDGLNRDGTLKHKHPEDKWTLDPLGCWNWKWNQARGNYYL